MFFTMKMYMFKDLDVPGLQKRVRSSKGKATKLEHFETALKALEHVRLFEWGDVEKEYLRLA